MSERPSSNWRSALEARELSLLAYVIKLVIQHEELTGQVMTAHELRRRLDEIG